MTFALFPAAGPRVFALPPGADFSRMVAAGLASRLGDQPAETIAHIRFVVNTQRTARALSEAFEGFADAQRNGAGFLPHINVLSGIGGVVAAPPSIDRLTRRLVLTRLVEARLRAAPDLAPMGAAGSLAGTLATLLDDFARNDVPLDRLSDALGQQEDRLAQHWQKSLEFLNILKSEWPVFLSTQNLMDIEARRAVATAAQISAWAENPPVVPVIGAGSTGSTLVTRRLLVAIANLPQGALILPGFDFGMDADGWERMGPDHPQFGFKALLDDLDVRPQDVAIWGNAPKDSARTRLLSEALRPAPITDRWRAKLPELAAEADAATENLTLVEAPGPRQEAEAIALVMRGAVVDEKGTAALVTPDRSLARRVTAVLLRWGIEPDDSAGRPLSLTPPGLMLRVVAECLARPFDPRTTLAALKHPQAAGGADRLDHIRDVERLEVSGLRNRDLRLSLISTDALLNAIAGDKAPLVTEGLAARLNVLRPWEVTARPLKEMVAAHRAAVDALSDGATWSGADGAAAEACLARFEHASDIYGETLPAGYPALFAAALSEAGDVRLDPYRGHPRIRILGPLEARAQTADLVILGGIIEGIWPQTPPIDPWLNRPMRAAIGLPAPERRTGLSAHDFQQAAAATRVVFTRSMKVDGAPTTPSRWLQRLTTLIDGAAPDRLEKMRADGAGWLALAQRLTTPEAPPPPDLAQAARPGPLPSAEARRERFSHLSVTQVKTLIRDPYALYARKILKLDALDDPGAPVDARDRGQALHKLMERFLLATKDAPWLGQIPAGDLYDRLADEVVAEVGAAPATSAAWRARMARIRPWFLRTEEARRADAKPLCAEIKGVATLPGGFTLSGVADRIDQRHDGTLAIYDYKAGDPPTEKQEYVYDHQLLLLAEMAAAGVFEGVPRARADQLAYLSLKGSGAGGAERTITPTEGEFANLIEWMTRFQKPETPFLARTAPEKTQWEGDYDHLSRFGEWGNGDDAEGE